MSTQDVYCQRCMVLVDAAGRCPKCGFDRSVSHLTAEDRAHIKRVVRGMGRSR